MPIIVTNVSKRVTDEVPWVFFTRRAGDVSGSLDLMGMNVPLMHGTCRLKRCEHVFTKKKKEGQRGKNE
jgi:hypothetical protein